MRVNSSWLWILAAGMLVILVIGLEQIAFAPLETGDAYPPFSSLRSDPQGGRALYESLAELPGLQVERLYKDRKLSADETMLVLGVDLAEFVKSDVDVLKEYEKSVENGGRLVIGFKPVAVYWKAPHTLSLLAARWHITFESRSGGDATSGGIPRETKLYFETRPASGDPGETSWTVIAADPSDGEAETVERSFGKGTIVLAANTFPLSNEGLREVRNPGEIAALIGPARYVFFDETHLGVNETGSVTQLMRRYRLQGGIAVLIVVAALFLWRSASSLLPPRESALVSGASKNTIAGRDSLDGLTALLHRGVSKKTLLNACFAEWAKSAPRRARGGIAVAERVKQELARPGDPVDGYRAACRILTEKR